MYPAPKANGELRWRTSTRSAGNGACVEVAPTSPGIAVRDSKNPAGPALRFGATAWTDFIGAVSSGVYDNR